VLSQIGQRQMMEVSAQSDHNLHRIGGQAQQQLDEPLPLSVRALDVEPLELVGHYDQPRRRGGLKSISPREEA
jgi:hypothetical protein